jgi:hypothetical protein
LVLNPNNKDAINNLKFAQKRTIDEIKVIPKLVLQSWFAILRSISLQHMGLDIGWIGCWLFLLDTIFHKLQCQKNFWDVCVFILFSSVCSLHFFEKSYFDNERPTLFCRKGLKANQEMAINHFVHEGTKVFVFETIGRWKKYNLQMEPKVGLIKRD